MNGISSFVALAALLLLALAAVGWVARPRQERLAANRLNLVEWAGIVHHGIRVVATWGPRVPYPYRRDVGAARAPHRSAPKSTTR